MVEENACVVHSLPSWDDAVEMETQALLQPTQFQFFVGGCAFVAVVYFSGTLQARLAAH